MALQTALREFRKAQNGAVEDLARENSPENRKLLHEISDTLKTLRSIHKKEHGLLNRVLKWLHVIP